MGRHFESEELVRVLTDALDQEPMSRSVISKTFGINEKKAERILDVMKARGIITNIGHKHTSRWVTVKHVAKKAEQTKNLPARADQQPAKVETVIEDGVPVTRAYAPLGRFEVDIPKGKGVISGDWKARRLAEVQSCGS